MDDCVLVLGGGPAGMFCALELSKAGRMLTVVEKDDCVGGLSRTLDFNFRGESWRTDIGPHRFFSKNQYLYGLIKEVLGVEWIKVDRFTRFYVNGRFFKYPVEIKNALLGVGPYIAFRMGFDYAVEKAKGALARDEPRSFEDYVVRNFGRTLGEFNMLNYTEKIWGIPCSRINPDWAVQRIKGLSVYSTLKNAVMKSKDSPKTLVDQFYYPKNGAGMLYERIGKKVASEGSRILLNSQPERITHEGGRIMSVLVKTPDGVEEFSPRQLVSSIPIMKLASLLEPKPPAEVFEALKKLRYRALVCVFILVDRPSVGRDNWVYFPDKTIPFGRVSEMKNFSRVMSPEGKTSLFVEFFCFEGDDVWNAPDENVFNIAVESLHKTGFLNGRDALKYYVLRIPGAYPVYDLEYRDNLRKVKDYLNGFANLQYIGRSGRFKYTNQDHSIEMGILAARNIIEGAQKYDLEEVGTENDYFEKGYIP